jgi:hypothetical protein
MGADAWNPLLEGPVYNPNDPSTWLLDDSVFFQEELTVQQLQSAGGYDTSIKSVRELKQAIASSPNGYIDVQKASSAYVFATENGGVFGSFSVTLNPLNPSMYRISESSILSLASGAGAIGIGAILLVLLLTKK